MTIDPVKPTRMELRYSQVEELVFALLDVNKERRSALTARLTLFRQRNFPSNVIVRSRTLFLYELEAVLRIGLAFWMMRAGIGQDAVPATIERVWPDLRVAFRTAFKRINAHGPDDANVAVDRTMLLIRTNNLQALSLPRDAEVASDAAVRLQVTTAETVARLLDQGDDRQGSAFEPITLIDIQRLGGWIRDFVLAKRWATPDEFVDFAADV